MKSLSGCDCKHYHLDEKQIKEQIEWIYETVVRAIDTHQKVHFQNAGKCPNDFKMVLLNVCTNLVTSAVAASAGDSDECKATLVAQHIAKICVDLGIAQDTKIEMINPRMDEELH